MSKFCLSAAVAITHNPRGGIGKDGTLPWVAIGEGLFSIELG